MFRMHISVPRVVGFFTVFRTVDPTSTVLLLDAKLARRLKKLATERTTEGVGFSYLEILVNYQRIVYVRAGTYSYLILLHIVHTTVEQLVYGTGQL